MNTYEIYCQMLQIAEYSPSAETAKEVCVLRGDLPYDPVSCPYGAIYKWQAVVYEAMLMRGL